MELRVRRSSAGKADHSAQTALTGFPGERPHSRLFPVGKDVDAPGDR